MKNSESMPLGIVLERRRIDHPWQDHSWRPVSVIPGAPPVDGFRLIRGGQGWAQYHADTLTLELFPGETDGYRHNLSQRQPAVYVVLRSEGSRFEDAPKPFHVTACPYEARDYSETGEDVVDSVTMPDLVAAWVRAFAEKHHVEQPFHKRKRKAAYSPESGPTPGGEGGSADG